MVILIIMLIILIIQFLLLLLLIIIIIIIITKILILLLIIMTTSLGAGLAVVGRRARSAVAAFTLKQGVSYMFAITSSSSCGTPPPFVLVQ